MRPFLRSGIIGPFLMVLIVFPRVGMSHPMEDDIVAVSPWGPSMPVLPTFGMKRQESCSSQGMGQCGVGIYSSSNPQH